MTKLQLDRNQWFEAKRHNEVSEAEQARHNAETEAIAREANENTRLANEESARANRARESLTSEAQAEAARSNVAREFESFRHNSASEKLDSYVAVMNNQREWRKLSLTEQRQTVQNALDQASIKVREAEALLRTNEVKANLPAVERAKILAQIELDKRKLAQQQREFLITSQQKETDLSLKERETEAKELQAIGSFLKDFVGTLSSAVDIGTKIPLGPIHPRR